MDFGTKLRELRKNAGLTQTQLSERIGVAKSVVSYYETNERLPSYDVLKKIARTFHVTSDYLLGIDAKKTIDVSDLSDKEISALLNVIEVIVEQKRKKDC